MKAVSPNSVIFRTAVVYVFVTILNVSIFVLMVFENQLDLIAENAVIASQLKASNFKYRIDNVLSTDHELSTVNLNKILREAGSLDINTIAVFSETGKIFVEVADGKQPQRTDRKSTRLNSSH